MDTRQDRRRRRKFLSHSSNICAKPKNLFLVKTHARASRKEKGKVYFCRDKEREKKSQKKEKRRRSLKKEERSVRPREER